MLVAGQCGLELEDLLRNNHLQFVDPCQIGESTRIVLAVEDLFPIQVDFQATLAGGSELYGYVSGGIVAEELRRQPRGDREVPSRNAIRDINVYFTVL